MVEQTKQQQMVADYAATQPVLKAFEDRVDKVVAETPIGGIPDWGKCINSSIAEQNTDLLREAK